MEEEGGDGSWENFFEKKSSQTLSKNFNWITRRERRVIQNLFQKQILNPLKTLSLRIFMILIPYSIPQSKFFERVWENIPLIPPYKGGIRGMFSQFPSLPLSSLPSHSSDFF